jgi:Secretion system C-terminal sorting domain
MKKSTKLILILCLMVLTKFSNAQSIGISTKILKGIGFAEVHQIIHNKNGYFIIGSQGDDVMHKKLWLVQLDEKMKLLSSEIVHNFDITTPIQTAQLANGNRVILAQEKLNDNMDEQSVLFYLDANNSVFKTSLFTNNQHIHYTAIATSNQKIVLAGKVTHDANNPFTNDAFALAALNNTGEMLWQYQTECEFMHINITDVLLDNVGNITCAGSAVATQLHPLQDNAKDPLQNYWLGIQCNAKGILQNKSLLPGYANYNTAASILATNNNYIAVLNNKKYFGEATYVQFDKHLNIENTYQITGSPAIISGIMQSNDKIILGALFSNDVNNYSPGFIQIDKATNTTQSKASATLFDFFFINAISSNANDGFSISGTGYNNHEFSDAYIYPFNKNGEGICDYVNKEIELKKIRLRESTLQTRLASNTNIMVVSANAVIEKGSVQCSSICNTPDDLIVPENKNWSAWQKNNAEVFTFKVPTKWLNVYPNPTANIVKVDYLAARSDALMVTIFNQFGSIVFRQFIKNQDKFEIDITTFSVGKYYIKVNDGFGEAVEVIIKE